MPTKIVSIRDILNAIRENGYPQAFGDFFQAEGGATVSPNPALYGDSIVFGAACAMGQAAVNLGVRAVEVYNALSMMIDIENSAEKLDKEDIDYEEEVEVSALIANLNDNRKLSPAEIVDIIEYLLPPEELDVVVPLTEQEYNFVGAKEGNP